MHHKILKKWLHEIHEQVNELTSCVRGLYHPMGSDSEIVSHGIFVSVYHIQNDVK